MRVVLAAALATLIACCALALAAYAVESRHDFRALLAGSASLALLALAYVHLGLLPLALLQLSVAASVLVVLMLVASPLGESLPRPRDPSPRMLAGILAAAVLPLSVFAAIRHLSSAGPASALGGAGFVPLILFMHLIVLVACVVSIRRLLEEAREDAG